MSVSTCAIVVNTSFAPRRNGLIPEKISNNVLPIDTFALPDLTGDGLDFNKLVADFEKNLLLRAMKMSGGVKNRAAKLLLLNRTTLVEKLKRLNLPDPSID